MGNIMRTDRRILFRIFSFILLIAVCFSFITVTSADSPEESSSETEDSAFSAEYSVELLEGKTAGVMTGTPQDSIIRAKVQDVTIQYFNSATDLALALQTKKIDFIALPTVNYYTLVQQYTDLGYLDVAFAVYDIGTVFAKTEKGDALRAEFNQYINELKASGELEKMQDYWLFPNDWDTVDIPTTGQNGTLTFATTSTLKPFSFKLNDQNVGFEVDLAARFCREYGYSMKIEDVDFAGILSGITNGRYDFAASQISWTPERDQSVNFSEFYYTQTFVPIVNATVFSSPALITANTANADSDSSDAGAAVTDNSQEGQETQSGFWTSIRRSLIDEDRWISILQGLLITLLITVAGFALANLLGGIFCAMTMSRSKVLKFIAGIYSRLMQGLPIVVILMILYYIIFGHSKLSNIIVAIFGFGLVFGAYMAQLFQGSIESVDKGQWEAALTMGLTKGQVFVGIVLPQAIRAMLPGYFSNLISLMKGTAIVGYIAVNDLTKAGDIIRSNTYEAFVPLITVAVCYFAIACILIAIMNIIRKRLSQEYRRSVQML